MPRFIVRRMGSFLHPVIWIVLICGLSCVQVAAQPQLSADDPIVFDATTQSLVATGNAEFTHDELFLQADEVRFFREEQRAEARGNVRITQVGLRLVSNEVDYNVRTGEFRTGEFRAGVGPVFAEGESVSGTPAEMLARNVQIYYREPESGAPNVRAESARLIPGQGIEIQSLSARVGGVPLLYLPRLAQDFEETGIQARGEVGFRNNLGAYFRSRTLFPVTDDFSAGANLDLYTDRGVLIGPALDYNWEEGDQHLHSVFHSGWIRDDDERGLDVLGQAIQRDRFFAEYRHNQQLMEGVQIRGRLSRWSDSEITRDFRPDRYSLDQQPDSFVEMTMLGENHMLSIFARANVNRDFPVVERLPEIRYDKFSTELIPGTRLYHSGSISLVRLARDEIFLRPLGTQPRALLQGPLLPGPGGAGSLAGDFAELPSDTGGDNTDGPPTFTPGPPPTFTPPLLSSVSTLSTANTDTTSLRLPALSHDRFTVHYLLQRPIPLTDWLTLTPRSALHYSYYSENRSDADSLGRLMGEVGVDLEAVAHGQWDLQNEAWQIDGLRHILRPIVQWRYQPNGDSERSPLQFIDRQVLSRTLQPVDLEDIRYTDDLLDMNVLRFGVQNLLQTRAEGGGVRELAQVDLYQDVVFTDQPALNTTIPFEDDTFDATYLRLHSRPAHWLELTAIGRMQTEELTVDEVRLRAIVRSGNSWWVGAEVDHFQDLYEQYTGWVGIRLADRWRFVVQMRYDAELNLVSEQRYSLFQRLGNSLEVEYRLSFAEGATREDSVNFQVGLDLVRF